MKTAQTKSQDKSTHSWSPKPKDGIFFPFKQGKMNSFFGQATVQPKLKIGEPDDQYERQADRVADAVVQNNEVPIQRQHSGEEEELQMKPEPILQRKCKGCEDEGNLQIKGNDSSDVGSTTGDQISRQLEMSRGSENRLPGQIGSEMSRKIGADFNNVNVHTDSNAVQMSRSLGARAFTHGNDIYFNSGEYNPSTRHGKHLLAHELTHVVQQNSGLQTNRIQRNGGPIMSGIRDPSDTVNRRPSIVEVTAIDTRVEGDWYMPPTYAGWLAAATRIGEVEMTDVSSMVTNILNQIGDDQSMSRLNIIDHGNENWIQIGDDWINQNNVNQYSAELSRLSGRFTGSGFVHVQNCEAGQNISLLTELASIFGVPIYAGTSYHNPIYRFNLGDYVRVDPDGTVHEDVGRP